MTSHELAKRLLLMPDLPIGLNDSLLEPLNPHAGEHTMPTLEQIVALNAELDALADGDDQSFMAIGTRHVATWSKMPVIWLV